MVRFHVKGSYRKTKKFLKNAKDASYRKVLEYYGREGVEALARATPKDTGKTAESWGYEITEQKGRLKITWTNSNMNDGVSIAVLLQYGHATRNGGWVEGIDYINPAIRPIFDKIAKEAWKEVTQA